MNASSFLTCAMVVGAPTPLVALFVSAQKATLWMIQRGNALVNSMQTVISGHSLSKFFLITETICTLISDVDECAINPGICGVGVCVNKEGTYSCICPEGYMLLPSGKKCVGQ